MKKEELLSKYKQLTAERAALAKKTYNYVIEEPCMQLGHICGMNIASIKTAYGVIDEMITVSEKAIDAALPLIEKWLSDDDMFALDMEKIEALLGK